MLRKGNNYCYGLLVCEAPNRVSYLCKISSCLSWQSLYLVARFSAVSRTLLRASSRFLKSSSCWVLKFLSTLILWNNDVNLREIYYWVLEFLCALILSNNNVNLREIYYWVLEFLSALILSNNDVNLRKRLLLGPKFKFLSTLILSNNDVNLERFIIGSSNSSVPSFCQIMMCS